MSGMAASIGRAILWPAAGLLIWGGHFGAIYAIHAFACERGWDERLLLGLPWVVAAVIGVTVLALALLTWLFVLGQPGGEVLEGGEAEPRFTRWFGAGACLVAAFTILFQAIPAVVLPACW